MNYRKITPEFIEAYSVIKLIQPLAHDRSVIQTCTKTPEGKWSIKFSTNSTYHICEYDGVFRRCADCELNNSDEYIDCLTKQQLLSSGALVGRIKDCLKANLEVIYLV